jgi:hypothetical protein
MWDNMSANKLTLKSFSKEKVSFLVSQPFKALLTDKIKISNTA